MSVLIAGGGTGIGKALALKFAGLSQNVIILGRREEKLKEVQANFPQHIRYLSIDIAEPDSWLAINELLNSNSIKLKYFINSAAIIEPINKLQNLNLEEFNRLLQVNLTAPVFLIKSLIPFFESGARILNISSGAAHHPIISWLPYCASKAALWMVTQSLNVELKDYGIKCSSIMPGVVDTDMQKQIRGKTEEEFPSVNLFKAYRLLDVETVAEKIYKFITSYSDEKFTEKDWHVKDIQV